jgi:hypothetical protein
MNSPLTINYEIRPVKFTERKMLLAVLSKICNYFGGNYQYVGFGGLSFTDFKLFHKELHIDDMTSIEFGDKISKERASFNRPYAFVKLIYDHSTNALNEIDLLKKSIIWLDYDGKLDNYFFDDIQLIFSKLPVGSIYIITCNRELKNSIGNIFSVEEFMTQFGELAPFEIKPDDLTGNGNYLLIREMISKLIGNILTQRNKMGENLLFKQLFNILYNEESGANMFTYGGIISDESYDKGFQDLNLKKFDFISDSFEPYRLKIPHLTIKEVDYIDNVLGINESIINNKIVAPDQLDKYKKTYKFLPNFFDVRK